MAPSPRSRERWPSRRCATRRRRRCSRRPPTLTPPGSQSCRPCSPDPGHCPGRGAAGPVGADPGAGPTWREGSALHWPPGGGHRRRCGCRRGNCVVASCVIASIGCSWSGVVFLSRNPLSQMHRSTFLPIQPATTLILSVDWGLGVNLFLGAVIVADYLVRQFLLGGERWCHWGALGDRLRDLKPGWFFLVLRP